MTLGPGHTPPVRTADPGTLPTLPTPPPLPTATPEGGSPLPGTAGIAGTVKQGDELSSRPLAGVGMRLYRQSGFDCALTPPGTPYRTGLTDDEGGYAFNDLAPGRYLVSAGGGPECLPDRWHFGPSDPGTPDACAALVIELADGAASLFTNILYEATLPTGCPTPQSTP